MGQVLAAGVRFGALVVHRRARLGVAPSAFVRAVVTATRPHFFVLPAAACLAGAASLGGSPPGARVAVAALAVGVAWGVGQLLNDLVDLDADAIDAPDRPAVLGLLPEGPTALAAAALGALVALALSLCHPMGWLMALGSALLMFAYAPAKALPLLGNLVHGALMAALAWIGAAMQRPELGLAEVALKSWPSLATVGALAALYLQGNYEKDCAGDARAGYRTLAHVLGERGSALLRLGAGSALYYGAFRAELVSTSPALGLGALSALLLVASVGVSLGKGPLAGYRFTVGSTVSGLVALALPATGVPAAIGLLAFAWLLIELAFRRSPNP